MPKLSKGRLAAHVTHEHGGVRIAMPVEELRRWSREDLERAHESLIKYGPCPSFRSKIVAKSA